MGHYFGTDGIRGPVDTFITENLAKSLGQSLQTLNCDRLVVGRDPRASGARFAAAVVEGALSVGIDCIDAGVVSTPLLSHLSHRLHAIGVMVTASHNPYTDNGLKVFLFGKKLFEHEEAALEDVIDGRRTTPPDRRGRILPAIDALALYRELAAPLLRTNRFRIALDCANGATYRLAPALFAETGCSIVLSGAEPDGMNINRGVGSTHIDALVNLVVEARCDVGFAFDGDGDRLIAVGRDGQVYDGDMLVYVIATSRNAEGRLPGSAVALTKMSNLGLLRALERAGIGTIQTEVGDKYVLEALEKDGLAVGGENSGHVIDRNVLNTGDGVLNALHLLCIMSDTGKDLAALTADVHLFPDRLENVRGVDKTLVHHPVVVAKVAEVAARLGEDGKVLVRASGTEPLIRVSVSAPTVTIVDAAIAELVGLLRSL